MFDILYPRYQIKKPIRIIELFGGVGSQAMALRNIGANFEHYRLVEFDKFAIQSYNAVHGTDFPTMDITEVKGEDLGIIDTDKNDYMITYSFPCQDLSIAGKGKGMGRDSGTRSGLLWEVERLLDETEHLPQTLLMENVPQVIGKKNRADFDEWVKFLESKGYSNYFEKLNAKNYGVAQNRNRVFMVSVLGEYSFEFPKPIELTNTVKDYLEDEVEEKFYINTDKAKKLISKIDMKYGIGNNKLTVDGTIKNPKPKNVSNCITARYDSGVQNQQSDGTMVIEPMIKIKQLGNLTENSNRENPQTNRVYDASGLCPTLNCMQGGNRQPMIIEPKVAIKQATKKGYIECKIGVVADLSYPTSKLRRGRVQGGGDVYPTLTTGGNAIHKIESEYRIRKLTPKECWRLMGFTDEDFHKAESVCSNTQLYKQAGNSIVVPVLEGIFKQLLGD